MSIFLSRLYLCRLFRIFSPTSLRLQFIQMASLLSFASIKEICALLAADDDQEMPNDKWYFIAEYCGVDPGRWTRAERLLREGSCITLGDRPLTGVLDVVFSPGEPLMLFMEAPAGFIEAIVEVYLFHFIEPVSFIFNLLAK